MNGGLFKKLSGPSFSCDCGFMAVTFTWWPLEQTELAAGEDGGTQELFTAMSSLCCSSTLCSSFFRGSLFYLPQFLPLSSVLHNIRLFIQPTIRAHTHTPHTAPECVCWPITQGNFFFFLRGFHQSPTTLLRMVDLIVSEIPLYST